MNTKLINRIQQRHVKRFGIPASFVSYAPGRVEILGNHTDYNEGFVLSSAIHLGIGMAVSPSQTMQSTLHALDVDQEVDFSLPVQNPLPAPMWANYVLGVVNKLGAGKPLPHGFLATFAGDIPIASGLSSSAAVEVATALAFSMMYGITVQKLEIAKICQTAEHEFAGTRCGLLDQISSLFGKDHALVFSDFRSLEINTVSLGTDVCFLVADTGVMHNLVDSEYNERRMHCEQAADFFASVLDHPVTALRDVSLDEWKRFAGQMDPVDARRSAHIIEENHRVLEGRKRLSEGDFKGFGELMFQSHHSSQVNFENSCRELDVIVEQARELPSVSGARLSGGGFGGSVVMLINPDDAVKTARSVADQYQAEFGKPCEIRVVTPSAGAEVHACKNYKN